MWLKMSWKIGVPYCFITLFACVLIMLSPLQASASSEKCPRNTLGDVVCSSSTQSVSPGGGSVVTTPSTESSKPVAIAPLLSNITKAKSGGNIFSKILDLFSGFIGILKDVLSMALLNNSGDMKQLATQAVQIQQGLNQVPQMTCGGDQLGADVAAYAQNMIAQQISRLGLGSIGGASGIQKQVCSNVASVLGGKIAVPGNAQKDPSVKADCDSNWKKELGKMPATMRNKDLLNHIRETANGLGMDPDTLAGVIWLESRGDPKLTANSSKCQKCSATGLIQWLNSTSKGLGMHGNLSKSQHINHVKNMSIAQQMPWVTKYFRSCGWKAGMNDEQAYRCVHAGSPNGNAKDGASGKSTTTTFDKYVKPKIEAFRCAKFDWTSLKFPASK